MIYVVLVVGFSLGLDKVAVWATLPRETLRQYGQSNTYYYDPYACNEGTSGTTFCTPVSGENITWIGDSYSVGAQKIIEAEFPGISFGGVVNTDQSTIQDCKFVGTDTDCLANPTNPSGLKVLQNIIAAGKLKPYLVFALGTNGGWASSDVDEFNEIMSRHPDTKVVLVTLRTRDDDFASSNELLKKMVSEHENYSLADWAAAYKESYYNSDPDHPSDNNGFNEWVKVIKEAIPQNCTAGMLAGNSIGEKIWNYFVQAGIEGVSDNPAAIAGILGNLYTESGLNPFMRGESGGFGGLYMLMDSAGNELWSAITSTVGKDYWKFYGWWCGVGDYPGGSSCADSVLAQNNVPQDAIDTAIKMELDYLVLGEINGQKAGNQGFHSEFEDFIKNFSVITDKNSPRSYAELFLVLVEIAYETSSVGGQTPQDAGVRALGISRGYERWQGAKSRGDYAEEFFSRFANVGSPTVSSNASSNNTVMAVSSGGFHQYKDLTEIQIWDLAEVAMNENSANMTAFKNELSLMANLAEANGAQPPNGNNLWDYVGNGGWFATARYINGAHDQEIGAQYLDATRDVLVNGNRTLPTQIVEHDCIKCSAGVDHAYNDESHSVDLIDDYSQWKSGVTVLVQDSGGLSGSWVFYGWMGGEPGVGDPMGYYPENPPSSTVSSRQESNVCEDNTRVNGSGGAHIADVAVRMAWPVQAGQGDDAHVGKCKNASGVWETYSADNFPFSCPTNARDLYREQLHIRLPGSDGMDCGFFARTVLVYAGAAKEQVYGSSLEDYFASDENWEQLSDFSTANLKPGDVLFDAGHVIIYVGEYGGSYGTIASASLGQRVGQVTGFYNENFATEAWRYKGGAGDGLTPEQAKKLAYNYNANVGDWDGKVAKYGNYCNEARCATRFSNCVLFSAFFVEMFTDVGFGHGYPDGRDMVSALKEMGFETGSEPRPYAVFSTTGFHGSNHTGVVVAVDGDKIATVEAGYPYWPAEYKEFSAPADGAWIEYAYLDSRLDYSKLMDYLNR